MVKAVKRNFLVVEENIRLNEINNFQVCMYFNPSHFNLVHKLNLHFDHLEGLGADYIRVLAVYIDTSKSMQSYEGIEFTEEFKLLWKIAFQIRPNLDTLIHLKVS